MYPAVADVDPARSPFQCICHSPAFARLNAQLNESLSRRTFLAGSAGAMAAALWPESSGAAVPEAPKLPTAFKNVRLYDGISGTLRDGLTVVVEGQTIKAVGTNLGIIPEGMEVIDGGGRTLMPGLIDAHYHVMMASLPISQLLTADVGYINLSAAKEASDVLLRGFTSIRDMAGPSFSLKRAIDSGLTAPDGHSWGRAMHRARPVDG